MDQYNTSNNVVLTRAELTKIGDTMQENKMLKNTVQSLNSTITTINKGNRDLKKQLKTLLEENKAKEQDMKQKFKELHLEQKKVSSELGKYEAIPEFKGILDLYTTLLEFRKRIDKVIENDSIVSEKCKLDKQIEEYKQKNLQLEAVLRQNGIKNIGIRKTFALEQAEFDLRKIKESSHAKYITNKTKANYIRNNMKESIARLVETITNTLKGVQKQLAAHEVELENIKKSNEEFAERPTYDKIMNILLEEQNALMRDMLLAGINAKPGTHAGANINDNAESSSDSDCDSPDEDDVVSVHDGDKRYKVIMHNVNEECMDGLPDIQKIKAIIKSFTTLNTEDIAIERMGKMIAGKKRPIKVYLPTFQHVEVLLKTKNKLQNTCYSEIRIASYKKKIPVAGNKVNSQKKGRKRN